MNDLLRKLGAKLIGAKVELEYYEGFRNAEHIKRALNDIEHALEILKEIEEGERMIDFCCECENTIDSCTCKSDDYEQLHAEVDRLQQENEILRENLKTSQHECELLRKQIAEREEALIKCYNIAYDLMPNGECDHKIFEYAKELRNIGKLIGGAE